MSFVLHFLVYLIAFAAGIVAMLAILPRLVPAASEAEAFDDLEDAGYDDGYDVDDEAGYDEEDHR